MHSSDAAPIRGGHSLSSKLQLHMYAMVQTRHNRVMATRLGTPLRLGSILIQPVSDGTLLDDPSAIFVGARPEEWQPFVELDGQGKVELSLTCLLVEAGGRRILIDTGCGTQPDMPD